jgi:hypothetical protein
MTLSRFAVLMLGLLIFSSTAVLADSTSHKVTFVNNCTQPIWVGQAGHAQGNIYGDGWKMEAKGTNGIPTKTVKQIPLGFSGRWWPRTNCHFDGLGNCKDNKDCCDTGGCDVTGAGVYALKCNVKSGEAPVSLIEVTFDDPPKDPHDTYDLSAVDGISIPLKIAPDPGTFNPGINDKMFCKPYGWSKASSEICPTSLWDAEKKACWGPCKYYTGKLKNPEGIGHNTAANICCDSTNIHHTPIDGTSCARNQEIGGYGCSPLDGGSDNQKCFALTKGKHGYWGDLLDSRWPGMGTASLEYVKNLHDAIPGVYAWQFDDLRATYTCRKTGGHVDYTITFCP